MEDIERIYTPEEVEAIGGRVIERLNEDGYGKNNSIIVGYRNRLLSLGIVDFLLRNKYKRIFECAGVEDEEFCLFVNGSGFKDYCIKAELCAIVGDACKNPNVRNITGFEPRISKSV